MNLEIIIQGCPETVNGVKFNKFYARASNGTFYWGWMTVDTQVGMTAMEVI